MKKIGIIIGSLRKDSLSRKWANNLLALYPENYELEIVEIGNLPFYNQDFDLEGSIPEEIVDFRQRIKELDGVVFVTPEYNRSIPPALKNAIDIGSRPVSEQYWNGKPVLIVSHSPSRLGGFGANHHLRQVLVFLDMPIVKQPEIYIGASHECFDENGKIIIESRLNLLKRGVAAHLELMNKHR